MFENMRVPILLVEKLEGILYTRAKIQNTRKGKCRPYISSNGKSSICEVMVVVEGAEK